MHEKCKDHELRRAGTSEGESGREEGKGRTGLKQLLETAERKCAAPEGTRREAPECPADDVVDEFRDDTQEREVIQAKSWKLMRDVR